MAKNVIINGVTYPSVPYVESPKVGGGMAEFYDTSDATLSSGDQMLSPYTAYADGVKITGGIPTKMSSDVTASGDTVSVPAGYYENAVSKAVDHGSATTPDTTITANPEITVSNTGLITAEVSTEQNVTPVVTSGYVDTGVAGAVSVSGSKTKQLATQAATTITPGTTPQTIPAETYLTGAVTIAGDANLVGSNIVANHSIFGVDGEVELVSVTQDPVTKGLTIS